jgi:hypothetical protein
VYLSPLRPDPASLSDERMVMVLKRGRKGREGGKGGMMRDNRGVTKILSDGGKRCSERKHRNIRRGRRSRGRRRNNKWERLMTAKIIESKGRMTDKIDSILTN